MSVRLKSKAAFLSITIIYMVYKYMCIVCKLMHTHTSHTLTGTHTSHTLTGTHHRHTHTCV